MSARTKLNQGQNWIRPVKRLAIYMRDGFACGYCGATVEQATRLTLDHLVPHSCGGKNDTRNLVTCCLTCNSRRGDRPWTTFADAVANYLDHGVDGETIRGHIRGRIRCSLNMAEARAMILRRGTVRRILDDQINGGGDDGETTSTR